MEEKVILGLTFNPGLALTGFRTILSHLTVFLELRSRKTVRHSEQIMSADKYPSIFSRQMEAIVYL